MTTPRILKAILGLVLTGVITSKVNGHSPTVDLNLVAPWSAPNFLIEVAETIATHNETAYFDFITEFVQLEEKSSSFTPYQLYQEALKIVSPLGKDESNFFKLSLAIHEATPRIEAYNKFYRENVTPSVSSYDENCETWAQYGDKQYCQVKAFNDALHKQRTPVAPIEVLPFDHIVYSKLSSKKSSPTIVVYTNRFSSTFGEFYEYLSKAVKYHDFSFVIRYKPSENTPASPLYLSGYGVELALKKTDYLVIDDRSSQKSSKESVKDKVSNFGKKVGQSLFESGETPKIEPLTPTEISRLDYQAAQFLAKSNNTLDIFVQLLQDFPKYAKSISQVKIDPQFEEEISTNQASFLRAGMNAVWLNGKGLEYSQLDPFFLIRAIRSERKLIKSFEDLGFTAREAIDIISHPLLTKNGQSDTKEQSVYDVRDTPEEPFVNWWNDLENDKRYADWSSNLRDLSRPVYPGQLHPIKKNIYNLIIVEDLSRLESISRLVNDIQSFVQRMVPVRFGTISFIKDKDDISSIITGTLNYIKAEYGIAKGMGFLQLILESTLSSSTRSPTLQTVKAAFAKATSSGKPKSNNALNFEDALKSQDLFLQSTQAFLKRMGISEVTPENGVMFFNGQLLEFAEDKPWTHAMMPALSESTRYLQSMILMGSLEDDFDLYDHVLSQPGVLRNRNSFITPSNTNPLEFKEFKNIGELKYFQSDKESVAHTNIWVIANLNSKEGLKLALEGILAVESLPEARISLIHNPNVQDKVTGEITIPVIQENNEPTFSDFLGHIVSDTKETTLENLKGFVSYAIENIEDQSIDGSFNGQKIIPGSPIIELVAKEQSKKWVDTFNALESEGLDKRFHGIVINNRVVGPFDKETLFSSENFKSLFEYELSKRTTTIQEILFEVKPSVLENQNVADILSKTVYLIESDKADVKTTLLEENEPVYRNRVYRYITNTEHSRVVIGNLESCFLEIGLIIDPLSETAQVWIPMINTLAEIEGVAVVIYLNPEQELEELPLKRFYRYVFDSQPHFDDKTGVQNIPTAYFANLPIEPLYTLGVDTTNAWHITVREANMDLDNILLTSLKDETSVSALYELESILIEGHCVSSDDKQPPRGLEFEIVSKDAQRDTLVMANLGYFQLKAGPGIWDLRLREGPSSTIYSIEDIGTQGKWNWDAGDKAYRGPLALTSFEGLTVMPIVHKNPGMETANVLDYSVKKKDEGFWSSFSNKIMGKTENQELKEVPKKAEINIFSVASGKLYERFLSIMMASVMKHTESTVKFWFIENFLSPEFKDFVPHLAKQYNFEYEMVTYKWPAWLRAQHEKQRTIWGYKILFLDVLFPLSLDKVIFVDADQIVRTDLKELVDMDLQGAPYGYTPFCSDRTEMDGFRFWKEGYWKNHLRGRPYHISALYVVDLARFRQLAAGDRLRAQYQQLSADPNSLANLDQDLPNNMIHSVPIFSLPQEWLWCETWCSDESLKTAKTIDLCNNPLTKEPKLDRARRQIPEWETYDNEINELRKKSVSQEVETSKDSNEELATPKEHVKDEL